MKADHVLFVVYDFPPEGARGTKRSLKFIRYLPPNNWSVVVLTVRSSPNRSFHDGSLLAELPADLPVYRAWTPESLFYPGDGGIETHAGVRRPVVEAQKARGPSPIRKAIRYIYHGVGKFAKIPDSRILWLPFAVVKGLRAIRQKRCRVIYSSGPSHTNHVVGAILSRFTGLPLVIDFRDAWVGNPVQLTDHGLLARGNAFLERLCTRSASFIVCTTSGMKADFETRYHDVRRKCVLITNGFDPSDFVAETAAPAARPGNVLRIVHAGTLGRERSPKEFLQALGQLLQEKPELTSQIEVVFVGKSSLFADGRTIEDYVREYDCQSVVKLDGYVSRRESLDYMSQADLLLLIIGRVPTAGAFVYGISGKIYDYAAARRPVFTIAEPGSTAEIAQRLNLGPVVHPDNAEGIKSTLASLCESRRSGSIPYHLNLDVLKSFEFSSLTARLAECLDEACTSRK